MTQGKNLSNERRWRLSIVAGLSRNTMIHDPRVMDHRGRTHCGYPSRSEGMAQNRHRNSVRYSCSAKCRLVTANCTPKPTSSLSQMASRMPGPREK